MNRNLNADQFDYRMSHRPAGPGGEDGGSAFWDADSVMPDVSGPNGPQYYDNHAVAPGKRIPYHESISHESFEQIRASKGNPDAQVRIYRAVPKVEYGIQPGDWVSSSRRYAENHGKQENAADDWPVVESLASARELWGHGDDVNEWGWHPESQEKK